MTSFSDLPHQAQTPVYPTNQMICAYLQRYAEHFGLYSRVQQRACVQYIGRDPAERGWVVQFSDNYRVVRERIFSKVLVTTGRFNTPLIPLIPGLDSFSEAGGVTHAFRYKHPEQYRGQRVLVAGGSISALEIAGDLAMLGAARVITTNRRQRYVLHKLVAGVPVDHLLFTRFAALAEEAMPRELVSKGLREFIIRTCGSPEQFGAPKPAAAGCGFCPIRKPSDILRGQLKEQPKQRQ